MQSSTSEEITLARTTPHADKIHPAVGCEDLNCTQGDEAFAFIFLTEGTIPGVAWPPWAASFPRPGWLGPTLYSWSAQSLHCDRNGNTLRQWEILSHGRPCKWPYTFSFHKRFKYLGPYVAQDAWNSENYENDSSPPLRIFHLYKVENTKYYNNLPFLPIKGITFSKDSCKIQNSFLPKPRPRSQRHAAKKTLKKVEKTPRYFFRKITIFRQK